jgi:prophage regulatory protein
LAKNPPPLQGATAIPTPNSKDPTMDGIHATTLMRLPKVIQMTGLARSTIYKLISDERFPAPLKLTQRAVAWRLLDIEQWIASRGPTN